MPAESAEFPGRQRRERKDGSTVFYWVALPKAIAAGFLPKTERLDYPADSDAMSRRCIDLQAQMDRWLADPAREDRFDGKRVKTIRELIRLYTSDPESPYRALDHSTRKTYDWRLRQIDKSVGERAIACLTGKDFRRWYDQFRRPVKPDGPERISKAHQMMSMLRTLFTFGVLWRVPEAAVVREILGKMEFRDAPPREEHLTYEMAVAFIDKALELGDREMALSQALEFDLTLRQTDVIGKWEPSEHDPAIPKWVSGLLWEHIIRPQLILKYTPGKTEDSTNQKVVFDLNDYELVMRVLRCFPIIPDMGPLIVNRHTGLPFTYPTYHRRWLKIAELTKIIPKAVWNRDSRAGGVTEGGDAGANIEDLAQHAGHARVETTRRYNRKTLAKTKRVAKLRKEHRNRP